MSYFLLPPIDFRMTSHLKCDQSLSYIRCIHFVGSQRAHSINFYINKVKYVSLENSLIRLPLFDINSHVAWAKLEILMCY